jgi:hypothetical protein
MLTTLTTEHEEAERLRHRRLQACAVHRDFHVSFRWLFALLGWRTTFAR